MFNSQLEFCKTGEDLCVIECFLFIFLLSGACVITEEIMEKHNITLKSGEKQKVYAETGDVVEFKCMQGYLPTTSQSFQVTCSDGQLEYPRCDKNSKMLV